MRNVADIRNYLIANKDNKNIEFASKLIPNINKNSILGVKLPFLKKLAKSLLKDNYDLALNFIKDLPHKYLDETLLHCYIIAKTKDFDKLIKQINSLLPYANNWMITDTLLPKIFKVDKKLYENIEKWIKSNETYKIRFGIRMLLKYFIDDIYLERSQNLINKIKNYDYYVKMMIAWYLSEVCIKKYEFGIKILEAKNIDLFIHNKTIQKCIDSFRISNDKKAYLKTLRLKKQ